MTNCVKLIEINAAREFTRDQIDAVRKTGTGLSGPGRPVVGEGVLGGGASDVGGGPVTEENRATLATGEVVTSGLLPRIKPVWDIHLRDTNIILGGDGNYYMTGSSGDNIWKFNDGIELWKSADLIQWSYLGLVWSIEKDGGWEKLWRDHRGPTRAIWAPEIRYIHKNYCLTFGMPPGGMSILKSSTGKPEGPYVHATNPDKPLVGGIGPLPGSFLIDPTLFEDDDGAVYFTYGPANRIARMKDDLSDLAEPLRPVVLEDPPHDPATHHREPVGIGYEGATIFKREGKYYLGSTDHYYGRYSMCLAVSDSIYGPYKMRHESVPCNGGCNFFKARDGHWYSAFFGPDYRSPWREKPGIVRIKFDKVGKAGVAAEQPDFILLPPLPGVRLHVAPEGDDANPGTATKPLATLAAAQAAARAIAGRGEPVMVLLHHGIHYLPETLRFTEADSGTQEAPVVYAAVPGEKPVLSGGSRLELDWQPFRDGIFQAKTPAGLVMDQLFVNGVRQHMARYPKYDPKAAQFNGSAPDAISPERVARWADPADGYIHAMHVGLWGDMHWRILGKKADGSLEYEGGWQNNRPSPMHPQFRFVENIREELDAPGEWFHDAKSGMLYFIPPAAVDLKSATIEVVRLRHLIEFNGTRENPVKFVTVRGLTFRHTARTFMDNREPLLRSDWTVYRGGAVVFNGAEDSAIEACDFDQVGGNTVFVNNYNRRITVRGCLIRESGANGIAFVGDPMAVRSPVFNYDDKFDYATVDRTPGPLTDNYPADCLVEDCLITRSGRFEKQTAPVEIDMAQGITVRHCSIYDVPRAGINIGDGCWGGHVIENCDIFDTVLETGDHGSFNSWGRDRFWHPSVQEVDKQVAADPALPLLDVVQPIVMRNNRWRCDHGWDVDLDDGSSRYEIYNNLLLNGGLKLREGYDRIVTNNVIVNNSLHPHVWYENSGDVFARNIVMGPYRPAGMKLARWGREVDDNLFAAGVLLGEGHFGAWREQLTSTTYVTSESDRTKFADKGCDANSISGDPLFVDAAKGDFRVKAGSPALKLGFVNFPMDLFGVCSPRLKAMARTPVISPVVPGTPQIDAPVMAQVTWTWKGVTLRDMEGLEYSAFGVPADAGGVVVEEVPQQTGAHEAGLRMGDLVLGLNGRTVRGLTEFREALNATPAGAKLRMEIIRNQQRLPLMT
jgi:hypothetical protein